MEKKAKTWGPFTGRQLTTIVCTVLVVLLFPVGAWALSFSNVAITDPGGVNRAKVNSLGQLSVKGPVTATPTVTSLYVRGGPALSTGGVFAKVLSPPTGAALVVQSVHLDWVGAPSGAFASFGIGDSNCQISATVEYHDLAVPADSRDFNYQPGLVIPGGKALCALGVGSGVSLYTSAFGYLVPASSVSSAAATNNANTAPRRK